MTNKFPYLIGTVSFQSNLSLEQVGELLSLRVFGGLKFTGKESAIYDEVPAIFIKGHVIGFKVILSGYSGFSEDQGFCLSVFPELYIDGVEHQDIKIDEYLKQLLKVLFKDDSIIYVVD